LSEENVRAYVSFLSDINPVTLKQAVVNLVRINKIKFYPSVGEILSACEEISNYVNAYEEIPIAQDAWEKVRRCVSTYSFEHGLNHLDGITFQAAKTIWSSFNPRMGDDYNEASCRSQFIRCYEQLAEREQRNNKVANAIKENIVGRTVSSDAQLPSVRQLSKELGVSILTVKKAYDELEREGFIVIRQGLGTFVATMNQDLLKDEKQKDIESHLLEACKIAKTINLNKSELTELFNYIYEEGIEDE